MKSYLSSFLLLFFMVGQVNLAWATHYCGDKLMSSEVSLAPEKSDCCGDETSKTMDCCEDEVTVADADDYFGKSSHRVDLSPEFVHAFALTFFQVQDQIPLEEEHGEKTTHKGLLILDLNILYQNFLI